MFNDVDKTYKTDKVTSESKQLYFYSLLLISSLLHPFSSLLAYTLSNVLESDLVLGV